MRAHAFKALIAAVRSLGTPQRPQHEQQSTAEHACLAASSLLCWSMWRRDPSGNGWRRCKYFSPPLEARHTSKTALRAQLIHERQRLCNAYTSGGRSSSRGDWFKTVKIVPLHRMWAPCQATMRGVRSAGVKDGVKVHLALYLHNKAVFIRMKASLAPRRTWTYIYGMPRHCSGKFLS